VIVLCCHNFVDISLHVGGKGMHLEPSLTTSRKLFVFKFSGPESGAYFFAKCLTFQIIEVYGRDSPVGVLGSWAAMISSKSRPLAMQQTVKPSNHRTDFIVLPFLPLSFWHFSTNDDLGKAKQRTINIGFWIVWSIEGLIPMQGRDEWSWEGNKIDQAEGAADIGECSSTTELEKT